MNQEIKIMVGERPRYWKVIVTVDNTPYSGAYEKHLYTRDEAAKEALDYLVYRGLIKLSVSKVFVEKLKDIREGASLTIKFPHRETPMVVNKKFRVRNNILGLTSKCLYWYDENGTLMCSNSDYLFKNPSVLLNTKDYSLIAVGVDDEIAETLSSTVEALKKELLTIRGAETIVRRMKDDEFYSDDMMNSPLYNYMIELDRTFSNLITEYEIQLGGQ